MTLNTDVDIKVISKTGIFIILNLPISSPLINCILSFAPGRNTLCLVQKLNFEFKFPRHKKDSLLMQEQYIAEFKVIVLLSLELQLEVLLLADSKVNILSVIC